MDTKTKSYASEKKKLTCFDLINKLPELKDQNEWLKTDAYSQSLQSQLRHLDAAFTSFFRRVKQGSKEKGYPKFRNKHGRQSVQFPQGAKIDFEHGLTLLPKMDSLKTVFDRTFDGNIKTVTVSRETTGKFFVSFLVDNSQPLPTKQPIDSSKAIGLDLGLTHFLTTSNGDKIDNPRFLKQDSKKIAKLSRKVSKKPKEDATETRLEKDWP